VAHHLDIKIEVVRKICPGGTAQDNDGARGDNGVKISAEGEKNVYMVSEGYGGSGSGGMQ